MALVFSAGGFNIFVYGIIRRYWVDALASTCWDSRSGLIVFSFVLVCLGRVICAIQALPDQPAESARLLSGIIRIKYPHSTRRCAGYSAASCPVGAVHNRIGYNRFNIQRRAVNAICSGGSSSISDCCPSSRILGCHSVHKRSFVCSYYLLSAEKPPAFDYVQRHEVCCCIGYA